MNTNQTRYISAFSASRILHVTAAEVERFAAEGRLRKYQISKYLERFDLGEVEALARALASADSEPATRKSSGVVSGLRTTTEPVLSGIGSPGLFTVAPDDTPNCYRMAAQKIMLERQLQRELKSKEYVPVEQGFITLHRECPLYARGSSESMVLYKPAGQCLAADRRVPQLFIHPDDHVKSVLEIQNGLNKQLKDYLDLNHSTRGFPFVKLITVSMSDPAGEILAGLHSTVEILASELSKNQDAVGELLHELGGSFSVTLHSSRVMAYVLRFCMKNGYSVRDTKLLSLSALLHDIGKTQLPADVLSRSSAVANQEDVVLRAHPYIGFELLEEAGILDEIVKYGVIEHHERLDGSGYPNGARKLSMLGQLLGIIDEYDERRNRPKANLEMPTSIEILRELRTECESKRLNAQLFGAFAYSLV